MINPHPQVCDLRVNYKTIIQKRTNLKGCNFAKANFLKKMSRTYKFANPENDAGVRLFVPCRQAGGKEIQAGHNLDWYAYGFRMMDPQLGRWHVVDALAENYISTSPYAYVKNDPVNYVDLLGLERLAFDKHEVGGPGWISSMIYKFTTNGYQSGGMFFSGGTSEDFDRYQKEKAKGEDGSAKKGQSFGEWYTVQIRGVNTEDENSDDSQDKEGEDEENDGDNDWNNLLPVAKVFSIDLDFFFGSGGDVSPIGIIIMLQGPDAGEIGFFSDAGGGAGMDISGSLMEGNYFYTGNVDNLRLETFNGQRFSINAAMSFGADVGACITLSKYDEYGGRLVGTSLSVGFGAPFPWVLSGNANYGVTKVWRWRR